MNRLFYISTIVVLYLLTAYCILGCLGTGVSFKYEVDEAYIALDMKHTLSPENRDKEIAGIRVREKTLNKEYLLFLVAAIASFGLATGLIIYRINVLRVKKR